MSSKKDDLAPIRSPRETSRRSWGASGRRRQAAGKLIASPKMGDAVPLNRVASWFADRLHKLFDLAGVQ